MLTLVVSETLVSIFQKPKKKSIVKSETFPFNNFKQTIENKETTCIKP